MYSSLIADAIHRWQRLLHPAGKTIFSTGTDEHGSKVQQAANKNKTNVIDYCNEISGRYKSLAENFDVTFTDFIRTSEERHKTSVQSFWVGLFASILKICLKLIIIENFTTKWGYLFR